MGNDSKNSNTDVVEQNHETTPEILLSAIAWGSRLFLKAELNLDEIIPKFLETLGSASGVSRCYIFQNGIKDDKTLVTSLRYEWASGDHGRMSNSSFSDIPWVESGMGRWLEALSNKEPIYGIVDDLPEEEKRILASQGIKSVAVFPIFSNAEWWGFIGFNDCSIAREWQHEEIEALSIASAIIETALQRFKREEILSRSINKYAALISSIPTVVLNVDSDGYIVDYSNKAEDMLGLSTGELVDSRIENLCSPNEAHRIEAAIQKAFKEACFTQLETVLVKSDGIPIDVRIWVTPLLCDLDTVRYALVSVEDITNLKKVELEKKGLKEQITRRNKMESMASLAGGIAHDFSGIMSVISWNAKLALRDLPRGSLSRSSVERILTATERSQELAQQMLAYAGKGFFNPVKVNLSKMISVLCALLKPSVPENINFQCILPDDFPEIEVDPIQTDQLVMNLIKNAIESMSERSANIVVELMQKECDENSFQNMYYGEEPTPGEYMVIRITDEGYGMSDKTLKKLFDPFFSTKERGRGLGLSVVLGIVRAHKGAIQVESAYGKGSTFLVYLPLSVNMPHIP